MTQQKTTQFSSQDWRPETLSIRAGSEHSAFGENSEAIFLTSSFVFENAAQAAARFGGQEPGNIYSRFTNPTVTMFQNKLAALEGAELVWLPLAACPQFWLASWAYVPPETMWWHHAAYSAPACSYSVIFWRAGVCK